MKTYKISFLISLLLLFWSVCCTPQTKAAEQSPINSIQQSPLSDDQTDPINKNVFEYADIDLEENNENHFFSSNTILPILPSLSIQHTFDWKNYSFLIHKYSQSYSQQLLHSSQSYLSVFRI